MGGDGFWGDPGASGSGGVEKRSRGMNKEGTKEPMSQAPFLYCNWISLKQMSKKGEKEDMKVVD